MKQQAQVPALATAAVERLSVPQAAKYVGLSATTLNKMRCTGRGPRYLKLGSRIYYRRNDLDQYINANTVETTDSRGMAAA